MTKRIFVAVAGLMLALVSAPVDARTNDDGDRVSSGKARTSVSRARTSRASASRTCLTPAAQALLARIEAQFGRVQLISTCRPGARIAGTGKVSKHASGQAIDFNAPSGRKAEVVSWLIANHRSGGTMTYARMSHIHVDIGYHFVSLNSGGGGATRIASRRSTSRTAVASRSAPRAERAAASRELSGDAVLRLAMKD
jgi:hypothetical protein